MDEAQTRIRIEVVLTEAEKDIIEFLDSRDIPRATQIKMSLRDQIQRKDAEKFDERVRRLLYEAVAEVNGDKQIDYKKAFFREKAEKEQLAGELAKLRDAIRRLIS